MRTRGLCAESVLSSSAELIGPVMLTTQLQTRAWGFQSSLPPSPGLGQVFWVSLSGRDQNHSAMQGPAHLSASGKPAAQSPGMGGATAAAGLRVPVSYTHTHACTPACKHTSTQAHVLPLAPTSTLDLALAAIPLI